MKKILVAAVVMAVALGFAFKASAEEKTVTKVKEEGKKIVVEEKTKGTDETGAKIKEKEKIVVKEGEVNAKAKETVKSAEGTQKIKEKVHATAEEVDVKEKEVLKKKGEKEVVKAEEKVTKKGTEDVADVKIKKKGLKKEHVVFKSYNDGKMTITVVKGDAEVELPTSNSDKWTVHPKKMKKDAKITIYSTYDPKLVKNVVQEVEDGHVTGD